MINWVIYSWLSEALDIDGPSVVVSLNRQDRDVCVSEVSLDLLSNRDRVSGNFFLSIVPYVVGGIVASPDEHIGLDVRSYIVEHALQGDTRNIAKISTPLARGNVARLGRVADSCATT